MKYIGVEFEKIGKIYDVEVEDGVAVEAGSLVVVETSRGKEFATVVIAEKEKTDSEVLHLVRVASEKDIETREKQVQRALKILPKVQGVAKAEKLQINILDVSFTADGGKIIITFASEERVDFRQFVKKLAGEYKLKIELKQIASRDETKIVGGIGPCGRVCCCSSYLRDFKKIGIKMAKNQNLSLNPAKINGLCGKLMCCLGYENETYEVMGKTMPKIGSLVKTPKGDATVMYNDVLRQLVTVKLAGDDDYTVFEAKELQFGKGDKGATD